MSARRASRSTTRKGGARNRLPLLRGRSHCGRHGATELVKRGTGELTIENTGANTFSGGTTIIDGALNLNTAQGLGTGTVTLNGGRLVLNVTDANTPGLVATNALVFGGGAFVYGTGASQDISGLIDAANSTEVRIDTNGNDISWASYSQELGNAALVKLGGGSLDISVTAAAEDTTTTGAISVTEGQLTYNITLPAGSQATRVWAGAPLHRAGAALQFNEARAVNRTTVLTLSEPSAEPGTSSWETRKPPPTPAGGAAPGQRQQHRLHGHLQSWWATAPTLTGTKWASNAQAGGASLELDGRGFFVGGGDPVGADIHVTAPEAGSTATQPDPHSPEP